METSTGNWTDEKLMAEIRAGGARREAAWKRFYVQFRGSLRGYLLKENKDPDDLEFLLGEVFEPLDRRLSHPDFSLESASLLTYTWRAIRNRSNQDYRKGNISTVEIDAKMDAATFNTPEKAQIISEMMQRIEAMGEPCRTILKMSGMGYKNEEIAEAMGIVLQTAKNKLSSCRKQLINLIGGKDLY